MTRLLHLPAVVPADKITSATLHLPCGVTLNLVKAPKAKEVYVLVANLYQMVGHKAYHQQMPQGLNVQRTLAMHFARRNGNLDLPADAYISLKEVRKLFDACGLADNPAASWFSKRIRPILRRLLSIGVPSGPLRLETVNGLPARVFNGRICLDDLAWGASKVEGWPASPAAHYDFVDEVSEDNANVISRVLAKQADPYESSNNLCCASYQTALAFTSNLSPRLAFRLVSMATGEPNSYEVVDAWHSALR